MGTNGSVLSVKNCMDILIEGTYRSVLSEKETIIMSGHSQDNQRFFCGNVLIVIRTGI